MPESIKTLLIILIILADLAAFSLVINALSRKFTERFNRAKPSEDLQLQYQSELLEIQQLEKDCDQGAVPRKLFEEINAKKQGAAALLRLINPNLDEELSFYQLEDELIQLKIRPDREGLQYEVYICSNCDGEVMVGDKFCANCGYRL